MLGRRIKVKYEINGMAGHGWDRTKCLSDLIDVTGSTATNLVNVTLDAANGTAYYRMVYP